MNTRQIHIGCDFLFLVFILFILFSFYFISSNLEDNLFIIQRLSNSWNQKPYQYLQSTFSKPCSELGMLDLYSFKWPGTTLGCKCELESGNSVITRGYCPKDVSTNCHTVEPDPETTLNKWKNNYICGSSMNSKTYFQWNKVAPGKQCPERYKNCGIIDTIGNHLCINQNELCPINSLEFMKSGDNQGFQLKVSNEDYSGKIYSSFKIEEDRPCINSNEISFNEKNNILLNSNNFNYTCTSYITTEENEVLTSEPNYDVLDEYDQKNFYTQNGLDVKSYESSGVLKDLNSRIVRYYGSLYIGWKSECQKKEIFQFLNKGNGKEEITRALSNTRAYNIYLDVLIASICVIFLFCVCLFKYYKINMTSGKLDFTGTGITFLFIIYFLLALLNCALIYFSDVSLEILKSSKMSNDFFEMISITDCSDDFTNNSLRYYKKIFYINASRYFNLKLFGFFNFLVCMFFLLYIYFTKISGIEGARRVRSRYKAY